MPNVAITATDITKVFDEIIEASNELQAQYVTELARETYKGVISVWPVYTGYSWANHRINVQGGPISIIRPTKRPTARGSLVGTATNVHSEELRKLDRVGAELALTGRRRSRNITVGNAVSYAGDVGFSFGNGQAIYEEAAAQALAKVDDSKLKTSRKI